MVKVVWDLAHFKIVKGAPVGYRTTKDVVEKFLNVRTADQALLLLPNMYKALSHTDYNQFALDLTKITGLDSCVRAMVN